MDLRNYESARSHNRWFQEAKIPHCFALLALTGTASWELHFGHCAFTIPASNIVTTNSAAIMATVSSRVKAALLRPLAGLRIDIIVEKCSHVEGQQEHGRLV